VASVVPERRGSRVFISPRARKLAEANQAPIAEIKATGPEGAIIERDVRQWLVARVSAPAAMPVLEQGQAGLAKGPADGTLPAQRSTAAVEVNVTRLAAWYARLLENGAQPTYNSLILYILSRLSPDASLQCKAQASPGPVELALLMPTVDGFRCVPVKETQRQGVSGFATFERELSVLAASGNMPTVGAFVLAIFYSGEYNLDTFTPGKIGSACAVLSLGRFRQRQDGDQDAWLSLAFDTGTVDDLQAVQFMRSLVPLIENPELLLGM
jgi:pyruvate dehydrogenase E2 component (dihydrolipoamide acetyltransferase)